MKKLWIFLFAFLVGLGVIVGNRMSSEAMGVVVGVVLGVAASIPMTLLVMLFVARRDRKETQRRDSAYPPVVIVTPSGGNAQTSRMPYLPPAGYGGEGQRAFTVIGDEESYAIGPRSEGGFQ